MAEVLGVASAIAGLISLSGTVLAEGYAFVATVRRAPKELRELLCESAALDTVLDQLQGLVDESQGKEWDSARLKQLAQSESIKECKETLLLVQRSISRCQQIQGEGLRNLGKSVVWPFKEKETKEALVRLSRIRGHLAAILTVDMAATLRSVHKSSQEITVGMTELQKWTVKRDEAEERRSIFKWLDPNSTNVGDNLKEGLKHHHTGTGQWLFESDCFKSWSSGPSSVLWIHGIPGSGKTVLASSIIESLSPHISDPSKGLVYFFCDHRDSNKRTLQHFLVVGILQLLNQYPEHEDEVASLFRKYSSYPKGSISLEDQLALFVALAQNFPLVTIVIDALDECKEIDEFVGGLKHLIDDTDITIRMLITGRNDYSLERSVGVFATYRIALEQNIKNDINAFVTDEVNSRIETRKLKIRSDDLKELVIYSLSQHAHGMFIWATLQLDLISRLPSDKAIRDALYKLPRGLENTYIRLLQQVKDRNAENLETILKTLMWIVSSLVPMTLGQLAEAISIETGDTKRDTEKIMTDERDLLEMLGSLVIVNSTQKDPVVSLPHFTLYEFLQSDTLRAHDSLWMFYIPVPCILQVGITCIQYLSFSDFKSPCRSRQELHERKYSYKLFEFAARNWPSQIMTYGGRGPAVKNLLRHMDWFIEPCRGDNRNFISWQQVFHDDVDCCSVPANPLYYAMEFYMNNLFDVLLQHGADPELIYKRGYTPLHVAAIIGREENVAAILETGPDLEVPAPGTGPTALHLAAENGHFGVVKLLLEAGASPNSRSGSGSTPFYRAARNGSIPVMEILYQAGSDIDAATWDNWTPIFEAIEFMHVPAVEWLVRRGAALNQKILNGPSVLEFAKNTGHEEIINIIEFGLSRR